jgi:RNA polymerase sigma factor (sigma-70 family)
MVGMVNGSAPPHTGSDGRLLQRSLDDPQAYGAIFERHFDTLFGYAARRVGRQLAEEIATETFTQAFDRRRNFDFDRDDAAPWLFGIAANLLRRHWRTERRRLAAYARSTERSASLPDEVPRLDVLAALDQLSADEREALFLFAVADLSYEEIAAALSVPVGTVRSRLARARERVRRVVGDGPLTRPLSSDGKESLNV